MQEVFAESTNHHSLTWDPLTVTESVTSPTKFCSTAQFSIAVTLRNGQFPANCTCFESLAYQMADYTFYVSSLFADNLFKMFPSE